MFDVAVVGYGPVGALMARLLGMRGFSVAVFERESSPFLLPRAVHFDGEVMRVFQSADIAPQVAAVSRASTRGMHFVNAAGKTLMVRRGVEGIGPQGWHNNHYFHQPDLDRVLRQAAEACRGVKVFTDAEVVGVWEQDDCAGIEVAGRPERFRARYVVGCDGARSLVRRLIGATYDDLGLSQPWLVTDFILKGPPESFPQLSDYTVQHCDPARPMTACYVTGRRRRWEVMVKPGEDAAELARPENAWRLFERWIGPEDADLERTAVYTFRSVIANGWRRGRVLIAGDAAHQTPPFLGQGMCAGIRDCANLGWKLERVLRGTSPDSLLDTYESERKPHVRSFIDLAVEVGAVIQAEGSAAEERDRRFAEGSPRLFDFPQPQLGAGARDDAPPPVGVVFPQPLLDDGRRLDDALGTGFAVIGRRDVLAAAASASTGYWQAVDAVVLDQPGANIEAWLIRHGAGAVILRPDRYVFGIAADAPGLDLLSEKLRACLFRQQNCELPGA